MAVVTERSSPSIREPRNNGRRREALYLFVSPDGHNFKKWQEKEANQHGRKGMKREKIVIDLPPGELKTTAESVWGKRVGDDRYELENVPVWAYGLAYGDVVEANTGEDGRKHFRKLLSKGGLLTVRAAGPEADQDTFNKLYEELKRHAVAYERFSPSYAAFAMDPGAFAKVERTIDDAERSGAIHVEIANDEP
jgi:hypothetical protein